MKTLTFFTREHSYYCEFLNSAQTSFWYAGSQYLSVEHYMQVQKACYFNHFELARRILAVSHAQDAALLSTMLYGKCERLWGIVHSRVAYRGMRAKFQQHGNLYALLRGTVGKMLVFACEEDPLWGTGKKEDETMILGQCDGNLLGRLLARIRVELKEWERRGLLDYDDAFSHPEFFRHRVMRYEFDQLLDNMYTREAVLPYVMVMVYPGWSGLCDNDSFIPLTTANFPAGSYHLANTSPCSLLSVEEKPMAGYREMVQELYDLYRLGFVS